MKKTIKLGLFTLLALVVITLAAIPFIPAESYRAEIEYRISQAIGVQAKLGDISLISLPSPGISVKNIQLIDNKKTLITINSIRITPHLSSLLSNNPTIRNIRLTGVQLHVGDTPRLIELIENQQTSSSELPAISVSELTVKDSLVILDKQSTFGPFRIKATLSPEMRPQSLELLLQNEDFRLSMVNDNDSYKIKLLASNWTPPYKPAILIDKINTQGALTESSLKLYSLYITAYEGNISSKSVVLDWKKQWQLGSQINISGLNLGKVLKVFNNHSVDGTASGLLTLSAVSARPDELPDNARLQGDLRVINGNIYDADLETAARTLTGDWKVGGQTAFDEFKTRVDVTPALARLSSIKLTSSILKAEGKVTIKNQNTLKGKIHVGLNDPTGMVNMPLLVAGTIDEPRVRPTDEAIAGAAIGTAILGPGIGTAAGIKAGEILDKVSNFFSSDEDDKEDNE